LQRAALALQEMRHRIDTLERSRTEPIAIVGMGCRFPGGANDPASFWQLLRHGRNAVGEIPECRRKRLARTDSGDPQRGGFLERIDEFDAEFFGISPREAATMDPQQRLLLEVSWEALEHAGISPSRLMGSDTGVFIGISLNEFLQSSLFGDRSPIDIYTATGNALSVAAGRIAYSLGLQGPALAVDTACSSSLVAVHLACQSLRLGECRQAIAGGIYLMLAPQTTLAMAKLNALSADGYCKTFDATADGYGRGEGCGTIVLKRLSDARAHGDRILAVIRSSAVNHDGRSSGLTVPNGSAQQAVIRSALQNARVNPQDIRYVEAHGTGTPLGDPIEVRSLAAVLRGEGSDGTRTPLAIGSVKTNIGHLEAAAGIAGLMKVVLAMQHGEIPPHLHLQQLNDRIDLARGAISIPTQLTPWSSDRPRLAGISAFGFSGTNAHAILESAPDIPATAAKPRDRQILCLSAKTESALERRVEALADDLQQRSDLELADICATANAGRSHFTHRLAFLPSTKAQLQQMLQARQAVAPLPQNWGAASMPESDSAQRLEIAFYFPPATSQPPSAGASLYESAPQFRAAIDACVDCLEGGDRELLLPMLQGKVAPVPSSPPEKNLPQNLPQNWQQSIAAIRQVALTQLWRAWGIEPTVIVGDGIGERVAAWASGSLSLSDLLRQTMAQTDSAPQDSPERIGAAAMATIREAGCNVAIAIGSMSAPIETSGNLLWLSSLDSERDDWQVLLGSLSQVYVLGADILWQAVEEGQRRVPIALPTYPFERQTYGLDEIATQPSSSHSLLGKRLASPLNAIQFEADWHLDRLPLVRDHRLQGQPIANLVVYLEMLQAGAIATWGRPIRAWNSLLVPHPLAFDSVSVRRVQAILTSEGENSEGTAFQIFSYQSQDGESARWLPHITGQLQLVSSLPFSRNSGIAIEEVQRQCRECWNASTFYQQVRSLGADLGASCQVLETVWRRDGEALGKLARSKLTLASEYNLPIQELDACFSLFAACLPPACPDAYIILSLQQLEIDDSQRENVPLWVHAKVRIPITDWSDSQQTATLEADLMLLDDRGECVMRATRLQLRRWHPTSSQSGSIPPCSSQLDRRDRLETVVLDLSRLSEISPSEQLELAEHYLMATLAKLLRLPAEKLQRQQFLAELVDSLIAFELRSQIETDWQVRLSIEQFLGRSTISQLANCLLEEREIASLMTSERPISPSLEQSDETERLIL
ncbi:polyketide synthase dehydratase domain-containing protein, partial [Oscillatoriales cyanobacterium LEGE 11467]